MLLSSSSPPLKFNGWRRGDSEIELDDSVKLQAFQVPAGLPAERFDPQKKQNT
jgi:hypothetical protein